MMTQGTIALELRLGQELVQRRLMRKVGVSRAVIENVGWLISRHRRHEKDENAGQGFAIDVLIVDDPDNTVPCAVSIRTLRSQRLRVEVDADAEIGPAFAHDSTQSFE